MSRTLAGKCLIRRCSRNLRDCCLSVRLSSSRRSCSKRKKFMPSHQDAFMRIHELSIKLSVTANCSSIARTKTASMMARSKSHAVVCIYKITCFLFCFSIFLFIARRVVGFFQMLSSRKLKALGKEPARNKANKSSRKRKQKKKACSKNKCVVHWIPFFVAPSQNKLAGLTTCQTNTQEA